MNVPPFCKTKLFVLNSFAAIPFVVCKVKFALNIIAPVEVLPSTTLSAISIFINTKGTPVVFKPFIATLLAICISPLLLNAIFFTPVKAPLVNVGLMSNPTNTSLLAAAVSVGVNIVPCAKAEEADTFPVTVKIGLLVAGAVARLRASDPVTNTF